MSLNIVVCPNVRSAKIAFHRVYEEEADHTWLYNRKELKLTSPDGVVWQWITGTQGTFSFFHGKKYDKLYNYHLLSPDVSKYLLER